MAPLGQLKRCMISKKKSGYGKTRRGYGKTRRGYGRGVVTDGVPEKVGGTILLPI
jgi:hypothetical protein